MGGRGVLRPILNEGRRRTPVPAARDPKRGRREKRWEPRSVPRPLPGLDHQLSKSAGARRRVTSPASLIPPASSHLEGASCPAKTSSCLIPYSSRRIPPPSRHPIAPSRPIPRRSRGSTSSSRRPKEGERAPNDSSRHVHRNSQGKISGECLASSGERTATRSYSDMVRVKNQRKARKGSCKSLSDSLLGPSERRLEPCKGTGPEKDFQPGA